jgi:DNA repair protein RecO (recombination protein O)
LAQPPRSRGVSAPAVTLETYALLVRAIPYGESDLVAQFFTSAVGRVSAMVRGGRKSRKRAGGAFEPFHTVSVRLEDRGRELCTLKEAEIVVVRTRLVGHLGAMDGAGRVLRWVRSLCPPRVPEPEVWHTVSTLLDALEDACLRSDPQLDGEVSSLVAWAGLRLLAGAGFGLELEACVVCGKRCPEGRPVLVDVARGGVVCRACGGGELLLDGKTREAAVRVMQASEPLVDLGESVKGLEKLVVRALELHEVERGK